MLPPSHISCPVPRRNKNLRSIFCQYVFGSKILLQKMCRHQSWNNDLQSPTFWPQKAVFFCDLRGMVIILFLERNNTNQRLIYNYFHNNWLTKRLVEKPLKIKFFYARVLLIFSIVSAERKNRTTNMGRREYTQLAI